MKQIRATTIEQKTKAKKLEAAIAENLKGLGYGR